MKILMHICCAPCAVYPAEVLKSEGISFDGYYYNPNIHPVEEFELRRKTLEQYSEITGLKTIYSDVFMQEKWENFPGDRDERCTMCYETRLGETARMASAEGYDGFTTTLLVSPYQKHELIIDIAEKYAKIHGTSFIYRDFRTGFRKGQNAAREMGLYRQKYCGCILSLDRK